jgi:rapamycin-insensitive companion of mTOR
MYLCTNNMLAIRALVDTLRVPSTDTREIVLDMFFEVLNIKPAEWYRAFLDGKRLTSKHNILLGSIPYCRANNS